MQKKIGTMVLLLVLFSSAAVYLWFFGKPAGKSENPLLKVDLDKINRVIFENVFGPVELERTGLAWTMVRPVRDIVDPTIPSDIIMSLRSFRLGTVISENPAKYAQFHLEPGKATHAVIYIEGTEQPVLDAYIGKSAGSYGKSYFRFASSSAVYLADDLADDQFRRTPNGFRVAKIFAAPAVSATSITIKQEKLSWDLIPSSPTWINRSNNKPVDMGLVFGVLDKLDGLNANDYGTGTETPEILGFAKPYLSVDMVASSQTISLVVGSKAPQPFAQAPLMRYAKLEGRDAILMLREEPLSDLINSLKAIPR